MSTTYDIEPPTIAADWATSELGDPEANELWNDASEVAMPFITSARPTSVARHAVVVAAVACGIGLGAVFGLAVFDPPSTTQPVVMVPQVGVPTAGPTEPTSLPVPASASTPEHLPLAKPTVAAPESPPAVEGAPPAPEQPHTEVSSPTATEPGQPTFAPRPSGKPGDNPATVAIDVPQLPQPTPADPQKPGPTMELGPETDLPAMKPQLPPKVTLVTPKSRWTVNAQVPKSSKPKRGLKPVNRTRLNPIAKTGIASDE